MATQRQPVRRGKRFTAWGSSPALAASQRGLQCARQALQGEGASLLGEAGIAEIERFRVEDEARRSAQGCLRLPGVAE